MWDTTGGLRVLRAMWHCGVEASRGNGATLRSGDGMLFLQVRAPLHFPRSPSNPAWQGPGCRFPEGTSWTMHAWERHGTELHQRTVRHCCRLRVRYYDHGNLSSPSETAEQRGAEKPTILFLYIRPTSIFVVPRNAATCLRVLRYSHRTSMTKQYQRR